MVRSNRTAGVNSTPPPTPCQNEGTRHERRIRARSVAAVALHYTTEPGTFNMCTKSRRHPTSRRCVHAHMKICARLCSEVACVQKCAEVVPCAQRCQRWAQLHKAARCRRSAIAAMLRVGGSEHVIHPSPQRGFVV